MDVTSLVSEFIPGQVSCYLGHSNCTPWFCVELPGGTGYTFWFSRVLKSCELIWVCSSFIFCLCLEMPLLIKLTVCTSENYCIFNIAGLEFLSTLWYWSMDIFMYFYFPVPSVSVLSYTEQTYIELISLLLIVIKINKCSVLFSR